MTFASPQTKTPSKKKNNTPNKELVVKVNTSKGYVTLGRIGLYDESALHAQVAKLAPEQLQQLLAKSSIEVVAYTRSDDDKIELII